MKSDPAAIRIYSTLEDRVEGFRKKSLRFPQGSRLPPHLSPLLPDTLFPPTREGPSPIHPLFPAPSPFPQDPARYIRPEQGYALPGHLAQRDEDKHSTVSEVNEMSNISPSYAVDAPHDKSFFCVNGEKYANLRQLHVGLLTMKDDHFRHHVNEGKNDFATWIADVFADRALSKELSRVHSRALTAYKVGQRVRHLRTR